MQTKKYNHKFLLFVIVLFCLTNKKVQSQINLIPNEGFEDTLACPVGPGPIPVLDWIAIYGSPDYFNEIMTTCSFANNGFHNSFGGGYQSAHNGYAYMGFSTYCPLCGVNYREAIQAPLINTLIANKKYCISFYVNLANDTKYASDDIGSYLSATSNIPFPAPAQLYNTQGSIITDTVNWTLIKGIYTAQGNEQFINIGNFKNDANTTVIISNASSANPGTYYFIDDVSIYELPEIDAGINDSVYIGNSIQLNASCTGCWAGLQYKWYPTTGLSDSTILNPIASPTQTTTYYFGLVDTTGKIPCMVDYVDSVTVYVKGVGMNELEDQSLKIKIYPNPNNGNFTIEFSESKNYKMELINSMGDCIYRKKINATKTAIDLLLGNGVYNLKITDADNNKIIHKKIIIAK